MFNWQNITLLEEKLIKATEEAKTLIFNTVPNDEIVSIYLTGSLARRELNNASDIDLIIVVKSIDYVDRIEALKNLFSDPSITFSTLTLEELEQNIRFKPGSALPDRYIKRLDVLLHLYGQKLKPSDYPVRSDQEELKGLIENVRERMIPAFLNKQIGFKAFIKSGIWLAESEYRLINNKSPKSWSEISEFFKNDGHIVNKSLAYREKSTKDEKEIEKYVNDLKQYMDELEDKYLRN